MVDDQIINMLHTATTDQNGDDDEKDSIQYWSDVPDHHVNDK